MKVIYKLLAFLLVLGQVVTPVTTVSANTVGQPEKAVTTANLVDSQAESSQASDATSDDVSRQQASMADKASSSSASESSSSSAVTATSANQSSVSSASVKQTDGAKAVSESSVASQTTTSVASSASEHKKAPEPAKPADTKASKVAEAHVGQSITQYLPNNAHGTIIDNFTYEFKDQNGHAVDPENVQQDTNMSLYFEWSIPNELKDGYDLQSGDTFTFSLPENVTYVPIKNQPLVGTDGDVSFGTYDIAADGKVTFTFNENVNDASDISGTFRYSQGQVKVSVPGPSTVEVPVKDGTVPFSFTVQPTGGAAITKDGQLDQNRNTKSVTWTVDVNTEQHELKHAKLQEAMPDQVTIASVAIHALHMDLAGHVLDEGPLLTEGVDYQLDKQTGNVTFIGQYADTRQAFRVIYHTDIKQSAKPSENEASKLTLDNKATLTADNEKPASADKELTPEYDPMLTKQGQQVSNHQELKWTINFNLTEKDLKPNQAIITDTLHGKESTYLPETVKVVDTDGHELKADIDYKIDYIDNNNNHETKKMVITFLKGSNTADDVVLSKGVTVTYNTKYAQPLDDESGSVTVQNEAATDGAATGETTGKIDPIGVAKNVNLIDYVHKLVKWEIHFNQAEQTFHDVTLTDKMGPGLTLLLADNEHPFEVWDETTNQIVSNKDAYTVTPTDKLDGFTVKLNAKVVDPTHAYRIMYWTAIDYDQLGAGYHYQNTVDYDWKDVNNQPYHSGTKFDGQPLDNVKHDGVKNGDYNAQTKTITWSAAVNLQGHQLKNANITDEIQSGQTYVADSAKLYEISKIDQDNAHYVPGNHNLNETPVDTKITYDAATKTLVADLPNTNKMYALVYQTSLAGTVIGTTYKNTAIFNNGDKTPTSLDGQLNIPHGNEFVDKTGGLNPEDGSLVDYKLTVNASQSLIKDAVITDHPSNNQTIDFSTLQIQRAKVAVDGSLSTSKDAPLVQDVDYKVTQHEDGSFDITFLKDIETAYYVTYSALIESDDESVNLVNTANLVGKNAKQINGGKQLSLTVRNNGGTSQGTNYKLTVTKVDADNQANALAGASFALTKKNSTSFKAEQTTNAQGQLTFDKLKAGTYYLVETKAPAGYELDDQTATITVDKAHADAQHVVTYTAKDAVMTGSINLHKTGLHGVALAGAVFSLYNKADDQLVKQHLVTNQDGMLAVADLKPGDYYFVETKAPAGYRLDKTPHAFTIKLQTPGVKTETLSINNQAKTGSVALIKTDADTKQVLAGARFNLYDADNQLIDENLITDEDGHIQVDDLQPGDYHFVETQAPDGYRLNDEPIAVTLPLQVKGAAEVVTASAENVAKTGAVILHKIDSDTNQSLANAVFNLYDAADEIVAENLTTNKHGLIRVKHLKPGDYHFVEMQAPAGYELDKEPITVHIALQTVDAKHVVRVTAKNAQKTGSVVLTKTDADTNKPLAGAIFSLYNAAGEELQAGLMTDEAGEIKVDGLKPGEYYFKETQAPAGYDFDATKQYDFTVVLQTETKVATTSATNVEKPGSVVLTKFDSDTKQVLAGAEFNLYNQADELVQADLVTNEAGQIKVDGLKPGHYYFVETKAPAGYDLPTKHVRRGFDVKLQTTAMLATVKAFNAETTGSVVLTKTDADTDKFLANAEFSLYTKAGEIVKTGLVTDKAGQIKVDGLKPGEYYFKETKAPAGYDLDNRKRQFTVMLQTEAQVATVTATNEQTTGSVILTKTDADTKQVLAGATFSLYTAAGDVLQAGLKTDEAGQIKVDGLKPGQYYFVETQAPTGYRLVADKHYRFTVVLQTVKQIATVSVTNAPLLVAKKHNTNIKTPTILDKKRAVKVTAKEILVHRRDVKHGAAVLDRHNEKENKQLPITGEANNVLASLLGLIILMFVATVIYYYNKKSN